MLTIIITTFVALSLFIGKLNIYMLPLFPFVAYPAIVLLPKVEVTQIRFAVFVPAIVFTFVFPRVCVASYFTDFEFIHILPVPIAAFALSVCAVWGLFFVYKKSVYHAINSLSIGVLIAVFIGAFALPEFNRFIGFKELVQKSMVMDEKYGIEEFYFFKFRSGEDIDAYLQREVRKLEMDEIIHLSKEKEFILFIRNKDLKTNESLRKYVDS